MAKKVRKRKLRIGRVFLLLIVVTIIGYLCFKFVDIPIRSITVSGNNILSDQEIIELANLEDYPSFLSTISFMVSKKLENNFYIQKAKVKKGFLSMCIDVSETKVLYINRNDNTKYSINGTIKDKRSVNAPYLINEIPKQDVKDFKKAMNKLNVNILSKMSEIKHDPNDIDADRYYVYMDDGNEVYLTLNKFEKLNNYDTILESIGKQNGVLYLDYGDYFKAK